MLACNYAKGKWVSHERRPLYSGFGCKQWLSEPWACRLTQRKDFSYEKFRWQPESCDMPEFEGSNFLRRCSYFFFCYRPLFDAFLVVSLMFVYSSTKVSFMYSRIQGTIVFCFLNV